ncbi:MAG: hypothetical protein WBG71_02665 [Leeuwenhoekiella sp.]
MIQCSLLTVAQENFSLLNTLEKIYLQLDSNTHLAGDNLYFKGTVTLADGTPTTLSGVLYVDLIDTEGKIMESQRIKLTEGYGSGAFLLSSTLQTGSYLIRAYTQWSRNFDQEFFFKENVQIYASGGVRAASPFIESKVLDSQLQLTIDPLAIDSLHKRALRVYTNLDGKRDTISVESTEDNTYQLRYPAYENLKYASFQIETKNGKRAKTTLALDTTLVDLQFFPESGTMVQGLPARIGFKALDYQGRGLPVSGYIFNQNSDTVAQFSSNDLGMGAVRLKGLVSGSYFAKVTQVNGSFPQQTKQYPLPEPAPNGNILMVRKLGNSLNTGIFSSYLKSDSLKLLVKHRGRLLFNSVHKLNKGFIGILFPCKKLPEGILSFQLTDTEGNALAERLVYNSNPEYKSILEAEISKDTFNLREQTQLTLSLPKEKDTSMVSEASVLVVNSNLTGSYQNDRNILTYMNLESELRGEIESPGFYFTQSGVRWDDLDALMLTQGWRKYRFAEEQKNVKFFPEPRLTLGGRVSAAFAKSKAKENVEVSLMTFGNQTSVQVQETDSLGKFVFDLHAFEDSDLEVLIQTANKSGKNRNYTLQLDEVDVPEVLYENRTVANPVAQSLTRNYPREIKIPIVAVQPPELETGTEVLDEVLLSNYTMTPERQKVMDEYGEPDVVVDGKEIQGKERKWSYGLYSILLFEYADIVRIDRDSNQVMRAQVLFDTTLVVVDGIPVLDYEYDLIPNIDPSEVKSVEIIEFAKNISTLYATAYPQSDPREWPNIGHVIAIYTHGGRGLSGTQESKGILTTSVPVFEPQKTFYAPTYPEASGFVNQEKDVRAVIHWEPHLKIDDNGKAKLSFYNADIEGQVQIIVEAMTATGKIGYSRLIYWVSEKHK